MQVRVSISLTSYRRVSRCSTLVHYEGNPGQHLWQPAADEHIARNHLEEAYLQSVEYISILFCMAMQLLMLCMARSLLSTLSLNGTWPLQAIDTDLKWPHLLASPSVRLQKACMSPLTCDARCTCGDY